MPTLHVAAGMYIKSSKIDPFDHKNVYGATPPLIPTISISPENLLTFYIFYFYRSISNGCVSIKKLSFQRQLLLSVTVTE